MITDALIIKHSGQYDAEVVERLKLDNLGISKIGGLDNCVALTDLNLSSNIITEMSGLEALSWWA